MPAGCKMRGTPLAHNGFARSAQEPCLVFGRAVPRVRRLLFAVERLQRVLGAQFAFVAKELYQEYQEQDEGHTQTDEVERSQDDSATHVETQLGPRCEDEDRVPAAYDPRVVYERRAG